MKSNGERQATAGLRSLIGKPMRIAQAESVPPKLYGGTERVVAWLVDELVGLGHEVTLFASGDSMTGAELNAVCPRTLRLGRPRTDPMAVQAALIEDVACKAKHFDLIHAHIDWLHLPLLSRLSAPFLTTCQGRLDIPSCGTRLRSRRRYARVGNCRRAPNDGNVLFQRTERMISKMNGNQSRTLKVGDPRWKTATTDRGTISWDCLERSFRLTGMTVIRLQSSKTIWVRSSGCLGKLSESRWQG